MSRDSPDSPLLRWLALVGAGAGAIIAGLGFLDIVERSSNIGLVLALVTFLAVALLNRRFQVRAARIVAEASLHAVDSATQKLQYRALSKELESHKRLEQELMQAKQAAESATMAKGEFLATMSHEIRTPLNGILPMLEMLRGSRLSPDQQDILNVAYGSARQLLRIVDDILDYSKLEANKLDLEVVAFNLRDLLESVISLMSGVATKKGLRLVLRYDNQVRPQMRGDPTRLRQVLTNLVSNAIKFTERGSVTVSVTRLEDTRSHQNLRFTVRDSGIGIPADKLGALFTPFTQANASTTRLYGGTGLGLAISKRIVDLMGGNIGAESEPNAGSTFWFEVSVLKAAGDVEGDEVDLGHAKVLLIAADLQLQRRLKFAFSNWGVRFQIAFNTQEALNVLRATMGLGASHQFHLLVADLNAIRATAVSLHRNIRRESELDALQVVYLKGEFEVPLELLEPKRVQVLPRGFGDSDLRIAMSQLLTRSQSEDPDTPRSLSESAFSLGPEEPAGPGARIEPLSSIWERPAPVTPAPPRPAPSQSPEPTGAQAAGRERRVRGRLLLVEDNPVNLMVAQRVLSSLGLACTTASDGEQALERMANEPFDLVLMDCQMPVMDGYTASRAWRERERGLGAPRLPIIAMTANAMAGDRQKCIEAGMDAYLSKPVSREELLRTLQRWLPGAARPSQQVEPLPGDHAAPAPGDEAERVELAVDPAPAEVEVESVLDMEIVEDLREVMGGEFSRLVDTFLEDSPGHLLTLQAAAVAGDTPAMVVAAHSLKSASANLGALGLSELARQIEHGARQKRLDNPIQVVTALTGEYERVESALRALVGEAAQSLSFRGV